MPPPAEEKAHRIVVGVDGSPPSLAALRWALERARLSGDSLDAVIAWEYPAPVAGYGWVPPGADIDDIDYGAIAEQALSEAVSKVVDPGSGVTVRQLVMEGYPAQVLLDAAAGAGLLVVGSRGHGGFAGLLLGSVSQHCVHHAPCPVVVVREPAHSTG